MIVRIHFYEVREDCVFIVVWVENFENHKFEERHKHQFCLLLLLLNHINFIQIDKLKCLSTFHQLYPISGYIKKKLKGNHYVKWNVNGAPVNDMNWMDGSTLREKYSQKIKWSKLYDGHQFRVQSFVRGTNTDASVQRLQSARTLSSLWNGRCHVSNGVRECLQNRMN